MRIYEEQMIRPIKKSLQNSLLFFIIFISKQKQGGGNKSRQVITVCVYAVRTLEMKTKWIRRNGSTRPSSLFGVEEWS